jgi:DNA-binding transcriptional LysR family regulator
MTRKRLGELPTAENLQCFLAAVEHMNFRRAAAEVSLTPTAFGQRIKQLEERLGEVLFDRTTRRMQLTVAGLALIDEAKQSLIALEGCLDVAQGDILPLRFTVGSRFELARSWLAPALAEMCKSHPNYDIDMYCGSGSDILQRLNAGLLDCVVTSAPISRGGWQASVLHPETYVLVGSPSLLNETPLNTANDCKHHVLLDIDHSLPLTRYVANTPGAPLIFMGERYLGSGEAMLEFVRAGVGVAVLPEYMVSGYLDSGELLRLLPERDALTDTFRLLWKQDHPMGRAFSVLAEYLRMCPLR